ncbi:MAG: M1 family peptidase, partial [Chitinophagaceae bacterium]
MRKTVLFIQSLFIVFTCLAQKPDASFDTRSYLYQISVSDESDRIDVDATIRLVMLQKSESILFDLISVNQQGKGMTVSAVSSDTRALKFVQENNKLIISLSAAKGQTVELQIRYSGIPADGLIISKTKYGRRSFFADNWPDRARNWIVSVDEPADKASVEFAVTAPSHYQVIANGVLTEESNIEANKKLTRWRESLDLPTKVMTVGIADFAVQHLDSTGSVDIQTWVYPEDRDKGFYDFELAREM